MSGGKAAFTSHKGLYDTINMTKLGDAPWNHSNLSYQGEKGNSPLKWKTEDFTVWFCNPWMVVHNLLSNPGFENGFNAVKRLWSPSQWDRMNTGPFIYPSVTFIIMFNECTIMGFMVALLGFLSNLKSKSSIHLLLLLLASKEHVDDILFQKFHHQLFYTSLAKILHLSRLLWKSLRLLNSWWAFHQAIYSLGPYITDYPEQVLLACIVQDCVLSKYFCLCLYGCKLIFTDVQPIQMT